jgi:hypothetical protein
VARVADSQRGERAAAMSASANPHVCFGCQRPIADGEEHIHVPMDEWAAGEGLPGLGLDDLLTFVFCIPCTERSTSRGWTPEAHEVARP